MGEEGVGEREGEKAEVKEKGRRIGGRGGKGERKETRKDYFI